VYSTTSQCLYHSESCANHAIKLAIILAASYSLLFSPRLTRDRPHRVLLAPVHVMSYSLSYSPRPTRYGPRRQRPHCHPHHSRRAHHVVLIASYSSRRTHRVVLIASCSSCRVVFANFPLFPTLIAILHASKTAVMDVGNASCASFRFGACALEVVEDRVC